MTPGDEESATALHAAAAAGNEAEVRRLLASGVAAHEQEEAEGTSVLMRAAGAGHGAVVDILLEAGAPWNAIDRRGRCAGNYALDAGHQAIVDKLVDAGTRAELLLGAAARCAHHHAAATASESAEYLARSIRYEGDVLFDEAEDAVMMEWETPLMRAHADQLCAGRGDVLNVGFGMGIIDGLIAERSPRSHTIIEAHPGVLARIRRDGWFERSGVRVLSGRWQDVLPVLLAEGTRFDGIFYDTCDWTVDLRRKFSMLPGNS